MKVRAFLMAAFVVAGGAAFAQSGGQMAVAQGPNTQTYNVPADSKPPRIIKAGESFMVPREVPHDARPAPGSGPAHLAVTLVIDTGTAPRTPVKDVLIK